VVSRAKFNLLQSVDTLVYSGQATGPFELRASFDEFNLDILITYTGPPLELPEARPSNEEIIASEDGERRLAGFILRGLADRVGATYKDGKSTVLFHFDH
jgi:xanthine permease XanP